MAFSASGPTPLPGVAQAYQQQLAFSGQNYNNILSGYQSAQGNLASGLAGIYGGYGDVQKSVMHTLGVDGGGWGVAQPAADQIARQYAQSQGQNKLSLINAGLGNSTLLSNVLNQGTLQSNQAYGSLGAQLAQTAAGYQSQIGMAGLAARQQGLGMQSGLAQNYMGALAGYHLPSIPNLYGQFSYSNSPNGGGYGGTQGSASPGGAAGAVAGAGGMPYGGTGGANSFGYQGAYGGYGGYNPYATGQGGGGRSPGEQVVYPGTFDSTDLGMGVIGNDVTLQI